MIISGSLIKKEWYVMTRSRYFYLIVFLYDTVFILINLISVNIEPYYDENFSYGYQVIISSIRFILLGVVGGHLLASYFISDEYSSGSFGISITSGKLRRTIIASKIVVFLLFHLIISTIYMIGIVIVFTVHFGGFWPETNINYILRLLTVLFLGLVSCITTGTIVFMFSILIRKKIWAIGAGMFLTYFLAQLDNAHRDDPIPGIEYNYVYQIRHISWEIDAGGIALYIALNLIATLIAFVVTVFVFERKELK